MDFCYIHGFTAEIPVADTITVSPLCFRSFSPKQFFSEIQYGRLIPNFEQFIEHAAFLRKTSQAVEQPIIFPKMKNSIVSCLLCFLCHTLNWLEQTVCYLYFRKLNKDIVQEKYSKLITNISLYTICLKKTALKIVITVCKALTNNWYKVEMLNSMKAICPRIATKVVVKRKQYKKQHFRVHIVKEE